MASRATGTSPWSLLTSTPQIRHARPVPSANPTPSSRRRAVMPALRRGHAEEPIATHPPRERPDELLVVGGEKALDLDLREARRLELLDDLLGRVAARAG